MPFELPNTPQSPSQATFNDFASKATGSPIQHSLPTPAHSVNGSMSSLSAVDFQSQGEEITNKRKRDVDDQGDQEQKKVHVEDSRISIDDLHMDVGAKSLLCRTRKAPFLSMLLGVSVGGGNILVTLQTLLSIG